MEKNVCYIYRLTSDNSIFLVLPNNHFDEIKTANKIAKAEYVITNKNPYIKDKTTVSVGDVCYLNDIDRFVEITNIENYEISVFIHKDVDSETCVDSETFDEFFWITTCGDESRHTLVAEATALITDENYTNTDDNELNIGEICFVNDIKKRVKILKINTLFCF